MVQTQDLMSIIQIEGWSKEEYLLEHDKYSSNMYSSNHGDLLGSSSDKDVHHKHIRMMETQKYLRGSCYHHIECTTTTFMAAFMWRRLLNSSTLATTIYRKSERVSNGTSTQVRAQIINKCRMKTIQMELYNMRDPS